MGKGNRSAHRNRSKTLPSSPSHSFSSSSSSDFEFTIAISPRNKSSTADELFYKGQLLPLHLSPRISMVRTLQFLSSSSASTSVTTSRDSTGSTDSSASSDSTSSSHLALFAAAAAAAASTSTTCNSFRSNSIADDDGCGNVNSVLEKRHHEVNSRNSGGSNAQTPNKKLANKYFSLSRFSNVFKNNNSASNAATAASAVESNSKCGAGDSSGRYMESGSGSGTAAAGRRKVASSASAKEVIRKYLKKVKPLYEKLSAYHTVKQQQQQNQRDHTSRRTKTNNEAPASSSSLLTVVDRPSCSSTKSNNTRSTRPALGLRSQSSLGDLEIALLPGNSSNSSSCRSSSSSGADFVASSLSENLRYLSMRRSSKRSYVASCPSSMRSSPNHSGILNRAGLPAGHRSGDGGSAGSTNINGCGGSNGTTIKTASSGYSYSGTSTMEELQSAIQGAIAHCKNSMLQNSPCNNNGKGPAVATDVATIIGCSSSST